MTKSLFVGIGCEAEVIQALADGIHCKVGRPPIMYLGLPIGAKPRWKVLWDPIIEKKLSIRKAQYLSLGERITLIKASLSNLPIHYMSLFKMPKVGSARMDSTRRNFLWEGRSDSKKLYLMKWSEMMKPKRCGGLGSGNLDSKNWALLAKLWWRFGEEKEAQWRRIIASKYGGWALLLGMRGM